MNDKLLIESKMEATLNNGITYKFEEIMKGFISTYFNFNGKWSHMTKNFHNWDEVNEWMKQMNEPKVIPPLAPMKEGDYYSITGYYGD